MKHAPCLLLWYLYIGFACCFAFKLQDNIPDYNDYLSSLFNLNEIPERIGKFDEDKEKYLTSYVRNLFEEMSIYDYDTSLIVKYDTNVEEVEKQLANIHILHQTNVGQSYLYFDISNLPRNLQVSHVEIVILLDDQTYIYEDDNYDILDVTKDFQSAYRSNARQFMSRIKDETAFYDGITAQLVIFENVNHTLLSSLRIRRKRGTGIKQQEISLGGEDENNVCSVTPWEVHFRDMRWEGWLWAPSSYYANSCSGRCVTGEKECTFSSHAVVKYAYLKAKKNHGHNELKVNCSPYEYAPLTIQYINKHKHVKVKQVSHMRVVSCLCL